jgi:hypothetical protein
MFVYFLKCTNLYPEQVNAQRYQPISCLSLQAPILLGLLEKVKNNAHDFYPQVKLLFVTSS